MELTAFLAIGLLFSVVYNSNKKFDNTLFYQEAGSGEAVIFIHGTQEDYRVFLPQLEALQNDFRVIIYSRRYNYPNSIDYHNGDIFDPFTEAEDLESLIIYLNIEKVSLVGHSYGGLIAMAYADKNPNRVKSLILSEPPLLNISGCEKWYPAVQDGLIKKVSAAFETKDNSQILKAIFEFFAGADMQDLLPPDVIESMIANLTEMKALVNSKNPFPDLNTNLNPPVLIFTSGNTMPMIKCTNEALLKKIPEAKHIHLPDASHEMWYTQADFLSKNLRLFLLNPEIEGKK